MTATYTKKKQCPNCQKTGEVLWHQIHGIRLLEEGENGKIYYKAQCPECGFVWDVPKKRG